MSNMDNVFNSTKWIAAAASLPRKRTADDSQQSQSKKKQQLTPPTAHDHMRPTFTSALGPSPATSSEEYPQSALSPHEGTSPQADASPPTFLQPNSALLSLPYEIRHKIWEYVLPGGDFYCCKDYGYCQEPLKPDNRPLIVSRDKTSNGSDFQIHQTCPWRNRQGKPDNRLILLSRQTYEDTKDIVSKIPLHFIFGNVECLTQFEASLADHQKRYIKHFSLRTAFHCTPWLNKRGKGTAPSIEKTRIHHQARAIERIKGQAKIWHRHAQNRAQCIAKKFAGPLDRTTYGTYPRMTTLRDKRSVWEFAPTISIKIEKQLLYPTEKLLYLDEREKRKIEEMEKWKVDERDTPETYLTFDATTEESCFQRLYAECVQRLRDKHGPDDVDRENWATNLARGQAEEMVARQMEMVVDGEEK